MQARSCVGVWLSFLIPFYGFAIIDAELRYEVGASKAYSVGAACGSA
ncbi:hypothetical protein I546_2722 [Mycobacterium kansasii 732]|nr:hypothetical protein I546_2722 [Mycobacterium kansasii 732]